MRDNKKSLYGTGHYLTLALIFGAICAGILQGLPDAIDAIKSLW